MRQSVFSGSASSMPKNLFSTHGLVLLVTADRKKRIELHKAKHENSLLRLYLSYKQVGTCGAAPPRRTYPRCFISGRNAICPITNVFLANF